MKKVLSVLTCLMMGVTAAAGCGGGGARLTKAQFIHHADAICEQAAAEQVDLAARRRKGAVGEGHMEAVKSVVMPPMEKELRRLRALSPPEADEKKVQKIFAAIDKGIKDVETDYLDLFLEETDPFARSNKLARSYGFKACAESSHAEIKPRS